MLIVDDKAYMATAKGSWVNGSSEPESVIKFSLLLSLGS